MIALLPLLMLAAPAPARISTDSEEAQFRACVAQAESDPTAAILTATQWAHEDDSYLAKACHGLALANDGRSSLALDKLGEAAQAASAANDGRAAHFWAEAGNAALAEGLPESALVAFDRARALQQLNQQEQGDLEIDRAYALVALDRSGDAADALANARQLLPENGTAWLLSATLSRRMNNLPEALEQIRTAANLLPHDAGVALEAGNIASAAGDDATARAQWQQVIAIAPQSSQAVTATKRLAEPASEAKAPPTTTTPAEHDQSR